MLHLPGVVDHGDDDELASWPQCAARPACGSRTLTHPQARARWPGLRFDGAVVQQPDGGRVDADRTFARVGTRQPAAGADLRFDTPVTAVRRDGDHVAVTIGDTVVAAGAAVVAAAGWSATLLEPDSLRPSCRRSP